MSNDSKNTIYSEIKKRLSEQDESILKFLNKARSIEDVSVEFDIHRNTASKIIYGLYKSATISRDIGIDGKLKYRTNDFGNAIIKGIVK